MVGTVRALLGQCPEFWRSPEFRQSVAQRGDVIQLDPEHWCQVSDARGRLACSACNKFLVAAAPAANQLIR